MTNPKSRLIVVSNRVVGDQPPAGGLVFALDECLTARGGVWVGTAPETTDTPADTFTHHTGKAYDRYLMDLTDEDHAAFYLGYSNSVLWPLCHGRTDLMQISANDYAGYRAVNARMASQLAQLLTPDDIVWIHDYHFIPLAHELRALGVTNRIGFFLHIPFPAGHDLNALTQADHLMRWLGAYDFIGLQSERDVSQFLSAARLYAGGELLLNGEISIDGKPVSVRACPIGIDPEPFLNTPTPEQAPLVPLAQTERLIVGVDRLDYSKGLPQRFDAFAHFLNIRDADDPNDPTLLQIAPVSRGEVEAYQDIRLTLEQKAGTINGQFGRPDWTPIRYLSTAMDRDDVARIYRQAAVGLVTPLIDGMNLVAKEFVAAQDPDDPGVLILSQLAGAAEQLTDAVLVNPYDPLQMGQAIADALAMDLSERKARHAALLENVVDYDIAWWTEANLAHLQATMPQPVLAS